MFEIDEKQPVLPPYDDILNIMNDAEMAMSPAHVHGMLSGYSCVVDNGTTTSMVDLLLTELKPDTVDQETIADCFLDLLRLTQLQLNQDDYSFQCLLPEDSAALSERAAALGEWSAGFVMGANHAGLSVENATEEDVKDALTQFVEIALIDFESIGESDEEERDLTELAEYARIAAILIHETCVKSIDSPLH